MIDPKNLLAGIPEALRNPLIEEYASLCKAFNEGRWKQAGLDAGRFCEVVYSILHGTLSGSYAAGPFKPSNMVGDCRALENMPAAIVGDRSLRILIPRVLPALYEVRNNRGIGHVGGDVVPNKMDATFVRESATYVMAELIRIFHGVDTQQAQLAVDALVERSHPVVWEIDGTKRVLAPNLKAGDKALLLLYTTPGWTDSTTLKSWVRYAGQFSRVLNPLFDASLIEIKAGNVTITPLGIEHIEKRVLPGL